MLDTLYQLTPPLFALGMLRIDSPASNRRDIYGQDKSFFQLHERRSLYLRAAYVGEFDLELSIVEMLRTPPLHVLVTQLAKGIHQVTPVYRGKSFFYGNDSTDLEILQIVMEMARRNGIDAQEFAAFEQSHNKRIKVVGGIQ